VNQPATSRGVVFKEFTVERLTEYEEIRVPTINRNAEFSSERPRSSS
jgi:hypothetical protein